MNIHALKRFLDRATSHRRGSAMIMVMIFVMVIGLSIGTLVGFSVFQRRQHAGLRIYQEELTAAERSMDAVLGQIRFFAVHKPIQVGFQITNFHNAVLGITPPTEPGFSLVQPSITLTAGNIDQGTFDVINDPNDDWYGYAVQRGDYTVRVQSKKTSGYAQSIDHKGVALERVIRIQNVPPYAYAIFYGNTLEIDAGKRIDVVGRVHTNGNFYLTTSSEAYYHNFVTVAGNFYGGYYEPHTGRGRSGQNQIYITTDGTSDPGDTSNMANVYGRADDASEYLTSHDIDLSDSNFPETAYTNWVNESRTRWNGYLRDKSHGIQKVGLPIGSDVDPHVIIERADVNDPPDVANVKFENKADIRIFGDPRDVNSIYVLDKNDNDITASFTYTDVHGDPQTVFSVSQIRNGREVYWDSADGEYEAKTVHMVDIDMGKLADSGVSLGDGLIYAAMDQSSTDTTIQSGVRITNASSIPTNSQGALTVATAGPLYTKGDVNTNGTAIVMLAGDSIHPLSNAFNDSDYQSNNASTTVNGTTYRYPSPQNGTDTTTNAIFMSGNVPSDDPNNYGRYSGGAENYFRYLEKWSKHTFNGSLLNLYESQIATGPWDWDDRPGKQKSSYYSPPRRVWSWDQNLAGITPPPGMPTFMTISLLEWKLVTPVS